MNNPSGNAMKRKLDKNDIRFTESSGGTDIYFDCPFCGRDSKLYLNVSDGEKNGMWECKVCGQKSRYFKRLEKVIVSDNKPHNKREVKEAKVTSDNKHIKEIVLDNCERLRDSEDAQYYLYETRKLSPKVVKEELIGVDQNGNITLPKFDVDGNLYAIKTKNMRYQEELEEYEAEIAGKSDQEIEELDVVKPAPYFGRSSETLINSKVLKDSPEEVVIVEGYWDVYAARSFGVENVVGVPSAKAKNDKWMDRLKKVDKYVLIYDNDQTGQQAAYEMAKRLGIGKCRNVVLPENDVNDCLKAEMSAVDFKILISEAKEFDIEAVSGSMSFIDGVMDIFDNSNKLIGAESGFVTLDTALKGGLSLV